MNTLIDLVLRSIKYDAIPKDNITQLIKLYNSDKKMYARLLRFQEYKGPIVNNWPTSEKSDIIYDFSKGDEKDNKYNLYEHGIVVRTHKPVSVCGYRIFYVDRKEFMKEFPNEGSRRSLPEKEEKLFVLSGEDFQLFDPHHGEIRCQYEFSSGKECKNRAYFKSDNKYLCGMHSKSDKNRKSLVKFSPGEKKTMDEIRNTIWKQECESIKRLNIKYSRVGDVRLYRMKGMVSSVEHYPGYISIFPNFEHTKGASPSKHQNRKDGVGMSSLSPMKIGPIPVNESKTHPHRQKEAKNLENFRQGNKVWNNEIDEKGNPTETFYGQRIKMYSDSIPHRRKYPEIKGNEPVYSLWIDKTGVEKKFTYVESRQFYCTFYERLASKEQDFIKLKKMISDGYNVMICGYDAHDLSDDIEKEYLDKNKPFGHERVLYVMLKYPEKNWPWRKYKNQEF
jgi:hypothetical protein